MKNLYGLIALCILFPFLTSCNKETSEKNIDVVFFDAPYFCGQNQLTGPLRELYKPVDAEEFIITFSGSIYSLTSQSGKYISISDSSSSWVMKKRKELLKRETYDAILKNYQDIIGKLEFNRICTEGKDIDKDVVLNSILTSNNYSSIIAYSDNKEKTTWNGHPVVHDLDSVKQVLLDAEEGALNNILVLYVPQKTVIDTSMVINLDDDLSCPASLRTELALALQADLLNIADVNKSISERRDIAGYVWKEYFDDNAYIDNYAHKDDVNPEHWSPGNGKSYVIEHLVVMSSIVDINIVNIERHVKTNKITGLQVCETHNGTRSF